MQAEQLERLVRGGGGLEAVRSRVGGVETFEAVAYPLQTCC